MSTKGLQDRPPRKRRLAHLPVALVIFLSILGFSLGDLMETIPLFAPLVASHFFPFFHEIHDLLAVVIALYAAYKYHARLGVAAILVYLAAHIPYIIVELPENAPGFLRIIFVGFVALFGVWLMNQLHKSEERQKASQETLRQSEEKYRGLVGNIRLGIFRSTPGPSGRFLEVNRAMEEITGYSHEELLRINVSDLYLHPEERQAVIEEIASAQGKITKEVNFRKKDGAEIVVSDTKTPVKDDAGKVLYFDGVLGDITERKLAEERIAHLTTVLRSIRNVNQLITREKNRQSLIQKSCDLLVQRKGYEKTWILLLDRNSNFVAAASTGLGEYDFDFPKQLETGDYPVCITELLGQEQAFIAYDQPGKQHQGCILASEHSRQGIFRCKLEHGGKLYGVLGVAVPSKAVFDKEEQALFLELCGDVAFALANIENEERRQQAEEALRVAEQNFRSSVKDSPLGIRIVDIEGELLYANQTILDILGCGSIEELKATSMSKRYTPQSYAEHAERREKRRRGELTSNPYEVSLFHTDGGVRHLLVFRKEVVWNGERQFQVIYQDITEHKQMEEALRESEERYRSLVELSPYTIAVHSEGKIVYLNSAGAKLLRAANSEELIGKPIMDLLHPDYRETVGERIRRIMEKGEVVPTSGEKFIRVDGTTVDVEVMATPFSHHGKPAVLAIIVEITERKKMQEQLMAQDRLASIGQLTSGIAHELNNPLTSVIGFSELLLQRKDLPDDVKDDLKVVNDGAMRTARVVKNLLTFARKQPEEKLSLDVNENIERVLELRAYEQKVNNIKVNTHFASDLPQVMGNGFQLQQVFLNVIINAEYFMLESHQKRNLTITTERAGDFVRISFADDGPGISKEKLTNLFTPFFTTKPVGKGTGLGLSICYGIVAEHGGRIYAESELGKGATFVVELPVKQAEINQEVAR